MKHRNRRKERALCERAVAEIIDYELVNRKEIHEIVHKYRWVNKVIPYTPVDGPLGEFHKLYGELLKLSRYLEETEKAEEALDAYKKIADKTERHIIEWLIQYELLGKFLSRSFVNTFLSDSNVILEDFIQPLAEFKLQIGIKDFHPIIDFVCTFSSHYHILIEKYHNPAGDGIHYQNNIQYYEYKEPSLLEFIAPALKMPIEDVFKNHKEPFEVKRLKHIVPFKAYHRTSPSLELQKGHDLFHQDQYHDAIEVYKALLISRNDLEEAKAGLAICYFIIEDYEKAESMAAELSPYQYRELIHLITKVKSGLQDGGMQDEKAYEIADHFCQEALEEELVTDDRDKWLKEYEDLYKSTSIAPEGLPSIANANFKGQKYLNILQFHSIYVQRLFEQNILEQMSHKDAAEYFISRMDIQGLDKLLDYREYSDIEKPAFLEKLHQVFEKLKESGNTRLNSTCGTCRGCQHGHKGNAYIGDVDDSYIEILIFTENERVSDIFECNQFEYETFDKTYLGKKIALNMNGDSEYPF